MSGISHLFAPLRDTIQRELVPALFDNRGVEFAGDFLDLVGLPHRHGGMMLADPVAECGLKHSDSLAVTQSAMLQGLLSLLSAFSLMIMRKESMPLRWQSALPGVRERSRRQRR